MQLLQLENRAEEREDVNDETHLVRELPSMDTRDVIVTYPRIRRSHAPGLRAQSGESRPRVES